MNKKKVAGSFGSKKSIGTPINAQGKVMEGYKINSALLMLSKQRLKRSVSMTAD